MRLLNSGYLKRTVSSESIHEMQISRTCGWPRGLCAPALLCNDRKKDIGKVTNLCIWKSGPDWSRGSCDDRESSRAVDRGKASEDASILTQNPTLWTRDRDTRVSRTRHIQIESVFSSRLEKARSRVADFQILQILLLLLLLLLEREDSPLEGSYVAARVARVGESGAVSRPVKVEWPQRFEPRLSGTFPASCSDFGQFQRILAQSVAFQRRLSKSCSSRVSSHPRSKPNGILKSVERPSRPLKREVFESG